MQNDVQNQQRSGKIAAVIDVRRLAMYCRQLERELDSEKKRAAEKEETAARLTSDLEKTIRFAELGKRELERKKNESLSRLRAVVYFTGELDRLQAVERMFSNELVEPEVVTRLHERIAEEFRFLYPTHPLSRPQRDDSECLARKERWNGYRIRPAMEKSLGQ